MKTEEREQMSEKDSKAIHNLFYEFHTPDNLGLLKSKLADYVTAVRQKTRAVAFKDAVDAVRAKAKYLGQSDRQVAAQQVNGCLRAIDAILAAANSVPKDEPEGVDDDG